MSGRNVIQIEDVWKQYRLGTVSHATLQQDWQSWWARLRRKEDPNVSLDAVASDPSRFGERFWALQGVSFDVQEGEVLGIIGRNGAGKSTLLKILSRVTAPTRGQIKVRGRIASLLEVGTGFHPELTGRENIFLNGAILGMSKPEIRGKLDEIIAFSEVEKFIDTPVKRYSSGMYVRLAFAVAAHMEPEILVVDEVLAVGDAAFQKKCLGKMESIGREGRTVLFVSHQMAMVQKLCGRSALIANGRLEALGGSGEIVQQYLAGNRSSTGEFYRRGNGKIRFGNFRLADAQGNPRKQFIMGDSIGICFSLDFNETVNHPEISIEIKDRLGNTVAHISNADAEFNVRGGKGEAQEIAVTVANLLLAPTDYTLTLWVGLMDETFDYVADCLEFNLLQGAMVKRKGGYPRHARCFLPSAWRRGGHA